jgi:hypothetical protein
MNEKDLIGQWRINANNHTGELQLWRVGNAWDGRVWLDQNNLWENLANILFDPNTHILQYSRGTQQYAGKLGFDELVGTFTDAGQTYLWRAQRLWSHLTRVESAKPSVKFFSTRSAGPGAPIVLVLAEERLAGSLSSAFSGGASVLQRYLDDLQSEGWETFVYRYDVISDETGEHGHRHLPSEVLQLYRYIREFYHSSGGLLSGVVLIGDFPAAGTVSYEDRQVGNNLEQHELDYFCVDAMLADPFGYWEWLPIAPMVPPGNPGTLHLPYDEGRHPSGSLYPRDQWSASGFVHTRQSEVHHSQRNPNHYGSEPMYWIGRITAAQAAWRTGPQGWEYSVEEEIRLLVDYFNRNHAHRSGRRITNGYIFITDPGLANWQAEKNKMGAIIPQQNIIAHSDDPTVAAGQHASIANYITSFQQENLVCEYVMHSDWLNHSFDTQDPNAPTPPGANVFPANFPNSFTSPGSNFNVQLLHNGTVQAPHVLAIPNKAPTSRFYLLGGCDVGAIIHRPQFLIDGQHVSPATPLRRQYGALVLGVAYLMYANGLAVLAHNVTNPPGDYTVIYQTWQQGKSFGEGVLKLMQNENGANLPHYRNVVFGDPTLRLSY